MYIKGYGVPINHFNACILLSLAAMSGDEDSVKLRDTVQTELKAKDLARAKRIVSSWKVGTPLPLR
ncbi:MAG: SEL1-like repeat protein [Alphaproteobacteria bacterium]|nr:SEL1-like repeat protein [Alphaproteobacteria bacterium]